MKKIIYTVFVICIITLLTFCTDNQNQSYKTEISKIEKLLVPSCKGKLTFKVDSLEGGLAIMAYTGDVPQAAFWVKDNILYAANGTAMAWTNSISSRTTSISSMKYSPVGIDFDSVLKVVED